ncbi:MAG: DUF2752 domain-containing protein [Clostridiaceae bacterium]|nr:DUF2752 domain-containing protein [Clostridiaceae bacterium]
MNPQQPTEKMPKSPEERKRHKRSALLVIAVFLLFIAELFGSACFFSSVFGIPCAGCGSTRAFTLLLEGNFKEALRMHPLILVSLTILIAVPTYGLIKLIAKKRGKDFHFPLSPRAINILFFSLAALYLTVYIVRMILYFPHTEPMCFNHNSVWGRLVALIRHLFVR